MHDFIFAGGGLASCLTAYRLLQKHPDLDVLVVERDAALGGNHTWSLFTSDLGADELTWLAPFVVYRWSGYEVRFPGRRRRLATGYQSITSERLHAHMLTSVGRGRLRLNADVERVDGRGVILAGGERLNAACVVDGRGPEPSPRLHLGFQKFTGRVVRIEHPHGLTGPIIMDATVPQNGGYRFIYVLPLGRTELLIEDTRYSDQPGMDPAADRTAIDAYAAAQDWQIRAVLREEHGVLPITLGGDIAGYWHDAGELPRIGLRAALFHATTGYSLPDAVRLADRIAAKPDWTSATLHAYIKAYSTDHWRRQRYLRLLNRMLFLAAAPDQRYRVMQRFYGLSQGLIERFYGGGPTLADRIRILSGKPPVPIISALGCLREASSVKILERQRL